MQDIEKLVRLCHCGKERIVTARSFLLFVETDCGPFGMTACRLHRAIKVHSDSGELFFIQTVEHDLTHKATYILDAFCVGTL